MKEAIDYCIDNDILKEFLKTYRSEVTKSMQLNYEFDRQLELERADAIEEGMEIGIEKGIEKGANQILLSEGKYDELQKASKDKEYQKKLLAEYGLLNEKQGE